MMRLAEMFDREGPHANGDQLALVVVNWLRQQGEAYRYNGEYSAIDLTNLLILEICDETALRNNLPATYVASFRPRT